MQRLTFLVGLGLPILNVEMLHFLVELAFSFIKSALGEWNLNNLLDTRFLDSFKLLYLPERLLTFI